MTAPKRFVCRRCGRSYAFAQGLWRHRKREHSNEVHVDVTATGLRPALAEWAVEIAERRRRGLPAFDTVAGSKAEALRRKHVLATMKLHGRLRFEADQPKVAR